MIRFAFTILLLTGVAFAADDPFKDCQTDDAICVGRVLAGQIAGLKPVVTGETTVPLSCYAFSADKQKAMLYRGAQSIGEVISPEECKTMVATAQRGLACTKSQGLYHVTTVNTQIAWVTPALDSLDACVKKLQTP